jgi:hypothetical protein
MNAAPLVSNGPWGEIMLRPTLVGVALASVAFAAAAHDPDGIWDYWFLLQRNMRGASCCDGSHAHVLKEEDWKNGGTHYQVRIGGRWYDIEDWQMLKPAGPNPTGKAILWYNDISGNFVIYCFTPSHET